MAADRFHGTAATMRRAVDRAFQGTWEDERTWSGVAGPRREPVRAQVLPLGDGAGIRITATLLEAPLDAGLARTLLLENDPLVFGRFVGRGGAVVVEQTLVGGATLHVDEVQIGVWAVAWTAAAFRTRIAQRLSGVVPEELPVPGVAPRRGVEERLASTEARVERFLRERYGPFAHDASWGYHGGFGSARVFVSVRHYLESSTVVLAASPVLSGVPLEDALALDAHALMLDRPLGRLTFAEDRSELWVEHAVLGDDLDPNELAAAIDAVAVIADGEDDRLQAAYGGRRYADLR
jgi:hypothetical protein